ncbi:hypothetical protein BD289DRAFT_432153 [Coniella lustricola]|uniref:Secreted protein n=1 Tax=Coniella lustricola TaxID=2025994 RepID=A0A2T3AA05_9PEZI|nr:hypothetical protein BD289DRAFT_432153 [Coniella lustricola]
MAMKSQFLSVRLLCNIVLILVSQSCEPRQRVSRSLQELKVVNPQKFVFSLRAGFRDARNVSKKGDASLILSCSAQNTQPSRLLTERKETNLKRFLL